MAANDESDLQRSLSAEQNEGRVAVQDLLGGDVSDIRDGWKTVLASDIIRDGMGLELLDPSGTLVAEFFRSDPDKTVIVTTFSNGIPVNIFDLYYREALTRLDPFEDGTSFASVGIPELSTRCPGGSPPNKALQLTPNSLFQSARGAILAASGSVPALAVSAVWCS